ncbi:hypothetical protein [Helicobacter pullorum]|uniref:hypothetical protein n=1 Tax=Helicobacter pullorum TaxID=35818 RepID=UPI001DA4C5E5|nr:hypothetical protein [Helicobacter pullorum]HJF83537.1 hypothetical protein [Helicobacter pullorum]
MNLSNKISLHHYRYTITDYFIITIWITKAFSLKSTARKIAKTKDNSKSQESLLILPLLPQKF